MMLIAAAPTMRAAAEEVRTTTHQITDMTGRVVDLPLPLHRVADLWFAHNALVIMLKGGDQIKVTVVNPALLPWMFKIAPSLHDAILVDATNPNIEVLKRAEVEAAFLFNGSPALTGLQRLEIPGVQAGFLDLPAMLRAIDLTADALGTKSAQDIAQRYKALLQDKLVMLKNGLDHISPQDRPSVLHIVSLSPLRIDGAGTIIDEWIKTAGARNAVAASGNGRQVSLEEIVALDPDVIILAGSAGPFDPGTASGLWQNIRAVRDKRVYRNPMGVFPWDRYGPEFLLQIEWVAKTLHPEAFASLDLASETMSFYRAFFGYDLTLKEAQRILAAEPPLDNKP